MLKIYSFIYLTKRFAKDTVNGQTTEWCFAYGEADWLAGVKFSDIQAKATQFNDLGNINSNYDKTLRVNCN